MTIKQLISILDEFRGDTEVKIATDRDDDPSEVWDVLDYQADSLIADDNDESYVIIINY